MKIPTQLRQCILADFVHLGSAAAECILLPFVAGSGWLNRYFVAYGRYDWLILLRFIDKSVLLIVAPIGLPSIVDPIGLGVINYDARATRSSMRSTGLASRPQSPVPDGCTSFAARVGGP